LLDPVGRPDASDGVDGADLHSLTSWASARLRPDVTVVLDRASGAGTRGSPSMGEEHLRVQRWLARMAADEPHRYVVVDADAAPSTVAERVRDAVRPLVFPAVRPAWRWTRLAPRPATRR
jgi:dTMP kinase